jgi:CO dehydrogenase/acetyl-CoA synthase beta subunit
MDYSQIKDKSIIIIDNDSTRINEIKHYLKNQDHKDYRILNNIKELSIEEVRFDYLIAEHSVSKDIKFIGLEEFISMVRTDRDKSLNELLDESDNVIEQDEIDKLFGG